MDGIAAHSGMLAALRRELHRLRGIQHAPHNMHHAREHARVQADRLEERLTAYEERTPR